VCKEKIVKYRSALKTLLLASGFLGVLSYGIDASANLLVNEAGPTGAPAAGPDPMFDFSFSIGPDMGYGSLNTVDIGGGMFSAIGGSLTVTGGLDIGTYALSPGGPGVTISPFGAFAFDDVIYPASNPLLDVWGLLFSGGGLEINIWGNTPDNYSFYSHNGASYSVTDDSVATFRASAVSEPPTLMLLGAGLLGLGMLGWRRKGLQAQ
jgi:hypothetical protein